MTTHDMKTCTHASDPAERRPQFKLLSDVVNAVAVALIANVGLELLGMLGQIFVALEITPPGERWWRMALGACAATPVLAGFKILLRLVVR